MTLAGAETKENARPRVLSMSVAALKRVPDRNRASLQARIGPAAWGKVPYQLQIFAREGVGQKGTPQGEPGSGHGNNCRVSPPWDKELEHQFAGTSRSRPPNRGEGG